MKKIILCFLFCLSNKLTFCQSYPHGEPESFYKEYKQKMDSLSKLSGKTVTGSLIETIGEKKITTIFYWEDGKLKNMVLDTTSRQLPISRTNRTINPIRKTLHR